MTVLLEYISLSNVLLLSLHVYGSVHLLIVIIIIYIIIHNVHFSCIYSVASYI